MAITDAQIKALQAKAKAYKHSVGEGLQVLVNPTGTKYWRIKYRFGGKEKSYSIGIFPAVSVAAAFEAIRHVKSLLQAGIDPAIGKREAAMQKSLSKSPFRLAMSQKGSLTIETNNGLLSLTPSQTRALWSFLAVEDADDEVRQ